MRYIEKFFRHLKNGTLDDSIRYNLNIVKWKRSKRNKDFLMNTFDHDIKLKLYTDSELSRIIYQGGFEEEEFLFLDLFVKPGQVIFDIGANIGLHTLYCAKRIGKEGKIYSFEPVKKTYTRMIENISINEFKNIIPFNKALSNKTKEAEIATSQDGYDAWNSMAGSSGLPGSVFEFETISAIRLDDFLKSADCPKKVDFIKIDTEGWELPVLEGGVNFINKFEPTMMIEYAEDICSKFGIDVKLIYDYLKSLDYNLFKFDSSAKSFRLVNRDENFGVANLIASKKETFRIE